MRLRWRAGHLEYCTARMGQPSRALRLCCRLGLHFTAWDFARDGYFCECGSHYLLGEQISSNRIVPRPRGGVPWTDRSQSSATPACSG